MTIKEQAVSDAVIEQAAIYAWEAAPSSMVGCFRLWNDVPESEKDDWRKIARASLAPRPLEQQQAVSGDDWLIRQLEAWPVRVDHTKTIGIEYLMKRAAAALTASGVGRMRSAAQALIDDVRRRYPGEELRCPLMIELDTALQEDGRDD